MRHLASHLALVIAPILGSGCASFQTGSGQFGLSYPGTGCASANTSADLFGEAGTVEAWVQGDGDVGYVNHPLVAWSGAFALGMNADGLAWFGPDTGEVGGVSHGTGWLDGELHHVAATWTSAELTLFVDGERVAIWQSVEPTESSAGVGSEPGDKVQVGCWDSGSDSHDGIVDEVRISSTVRYLEDFAIPGDVFEMDEGTIHLWHMDEGTDSWAADDAGNGDLALEGVDWVEFSAWAVDTGETR